MRDLEAARKAKEEADAKAPATVGDVRRLEGKLDAALKSYVESNANKLLAVRTLCEERLASQKEDEKLHRQAVALLNVLVFVAGVGTAFALFAALARFI